MLMGVLPKCFTASPVCERVHLAEPAPEHWTCTPDRDLSARGRLAWFDPSAEGSHLRYIVPATRPLRRARDLQRTSNAN